MGNTMERYTMKNILQNELVQITLAITGAFFLIGMNTTVNYPYGLTDSYWVVLGGAMWLTIILSHVHAKAQARYISSGKHPKHGLLFCLRAALAIVVAYIIHRDLPDVSFAELYKTGTFRLTVTMGACFWLFFDLFLNHYRDKPLFYVSEYYRTAILDRLMRKVFSGSKPHFFLMFLVKFSILVWSVRFYMELN